MIDSTITNTPVGVITAFESISLPPTARSLILKNIIINNVRIAVQQFGAGALLDGTSGVLTIAAWGQGNQYTPDGPKRFQGPLTPVSRPESLLSGSTYYVRSKPQYSDIPVSSFKSVRSASATGNGRTDDTTALQNVIDSATSAGQVVYIISGTYKITRTLFIPAGTKIVSETYPIIDHSIKQ